MGIGERSQKRPRHAVSPAPAVGILAAVVLTAGCGPESVLRPGARALAELEGKLLHDEPFLVVPNQAWGRLEDEELWYFGASAAVVCQVDERPAEPIVFGFLPRDFGRPSEELELSWNGRDVSGRLRTLPSGEIQVPIPPEWLDPGAHFLNVRRSGADRRAADDFLVFRHIGYRFRGQPHVFDTRHFHRYRYVSNLLAFGVTGSFDPEVLGGFASAGPRSLAIDLGTDRGGLFQVRVLNSGAGRAVFRARAGEASRVARLRPHQRRHLSLEVPRRVRFLDLAVEGDPNGYFLWGAPHFQPAGAEALPPVVLVTLDTTRRDALGVYGGGTSITPHLDALAAGATVFDRAHTTAPWTIPAHASIFTGLYPSKHGAGLSSDHLEIGHTTLAEILRSRGYLTAGFAGGLLASSKFGLGQGFASYRDVQSFETPAGELTSAALAFLEQSVAAAEPAPPFFLFVNYFDPHFPYQAPKRFRGTAGVRSNGHGEVWAGVFEGDAEAWEKVVDGAAPADGETLAALTAAYRAEVAFMDEQVGELLAKLRERDLYDRTLIVVAADHGELLGENGRFSHNGRLDPELVEIPLIVKWPGQRTGSRDGRLVSLVDLFPTVLEVAGGRAEALSVDGLALGRDGGGSGGRAFVVAEEHDTDFHRLPPGMRIADHLYAVLGLEERLVTWSGGEDCLLREADGWRRRSCSGGYLAEIAEKTRRRLEESARRPSVDRIGLSREEHERLRALGYSR